VAVLPRGGRHRQRPRVARLSSAQSQGPGPGSRVMTLPRIAPRVGLALVALVQTAVLAWMVIDRTRLIKTGQDVVLPIRPVDPRDLFRGQYVRLGYDVSQVPERLIEGPRPTRNGTFYVTIERQDDDTWRPVKLTRDQPGTLGPRQMAIRGSAMHRFPQTVRD